MRSAVTKHETLLPTLVPSTCVQHWQSTKQCY